MPAERKSGYLFIALFIFLVIQYGLVGIIGVTDREPWPAFVFPGFKSVYVYDEGYEIEQIHFDLHILKGDTEVVQRYKPYDFFPQLPKSQLSGFLSVHFGSAQHIRSFSDETVSWLNEQAVKVTGLEPVRLEVISEKLYFPLYDEIVRPDSMSVNFRVEIRFEE